MAHGLRTAVASVALLLSTVGGQAATPRDALVIAWNLDALITFDPAQIGEVNGADIIVGNVCSPLVRYDPKDVTKILPGTAESWTSSPDGLTLTFKLRSDLKFPDGTPATAEDAAWSLQRAVQLGYFASSNLTQWGFNKDQIADQIQASDATTLVVKLSKPYPAPLLLSAAFANNSVSTILSKAAGLKNAKTTDGKSDLGNAFFKTGPVCVGPYRVARWDANDVVILERNDNFFGDKPGLRRVIIRHVPESSAERLLLEKGDIDVARILSTDDLKAVASNEDITIAQTLMHGITYIAMNTDDPILKNPKVREAIRYLIDYDGLEKTILPLQGRAACRPRTRGRVRRARSQGGPAVLAGSRKGQAIADGSRLSQRLQEEDDPVGQRHRPSHCPARREQRSQGGHHAGAGADGRRQPVHAWPQP